MPAKVLMNIILLLFASHFILPRICGSPIHAQQNKHVAEDLHTKRTPQTAGDGGPPFSVLGVAGVAGASVHPRLEIRQLEQNADQWNVYLLGLNRFQQMNQTDLLSYYQIAGENNYSFYYYYRL